MNFLEIFTSRPFTSETHCEKCRHKICCVVFDVMNDRGQGRFQEKIKNGGEKCKNLDENGNCRIYHNRHNACHNYHCYDAWPLISDWIDSHNSDILEDSRAISVILAVCQNFLQNNTGKENYTARYNFLKNFLQNTHSLDELATIWSVKNFLEENFKKIGKS